MTLSRLVPILLLTLLSAAPTWAGSRDGVGPVPLAGGCEARAVIDAGGCAGRREGWAGYDQWAYAQGGYGAYGYARSDCGPCDYGRGRLAVETREGDRYGERREAWYGQTGYASHGYDQGGCDQCGQGQARFAVEAREADRYDERREIWYGRRDDAAAYAYEQQQRLCGCAGGYDQGRGGPVYPYPPYKPQGYVTAGRDDYGWLVWAGKRP